MYLTDLEIEEYLRESFYSYSKNGDMGICERKIKNGFIVRTDLYSMKKFISKLSKNLFKEEFQSRIDSEREFVFIVEKMIQETFKNIDNEKILIEKITEELKAKYSL